MKRSGWFRLPITAVPLFAILSFLSCRAALRHSFSSVSPTADAWRLYNASLLHLASTDPSESMVSGDVDALLAGKFPASAHSTVAAWRSSTAAAQRGNRNSSVEVRSDYAIFSELRKSLSNWWCNRKFPLEIMPELVELVKRPLDLHAGGPDSNHRYNTCAVVGNSGILLNSDHGNLIDGHDLVIRLNNALTNGYHRYVGSKTGLSFINSNILHLCARRSGCFCHPYGDTVPIIIYICQAAHFLDYTICNASHKAPLLVTDIRFDMLCTRIVKHYSLKRFAEMTGKPPEDWPKYHDEKMFHYSSGMQAVMLALGICDQVSVFGFGKSTNARHHYHTNQNNELDLHDYEAEYALYRDLMQRPEAVPLLQNFGFKVPPLVFYR
ncbi:hypothetical protein KSP39_PZI017796 [Platanthera zijinensis]|uniref:Sialyltransferase-like protein 1 n=1 Tax=Platanthera zijinensis TaxID=2320716 RepID=A0AAP0B7H9_9ASPA